MALSQLEGRARRDVPSAAMLIRRMFLALVLAAPTVSSAATFHVARNGGADANPGSKQRPFATLERARDEVRKLKGAGALHEAVNVVVHGGSYVRSSSLELNASD